MEPVPESEGNVLLGTNKVAKFWLIHHSAQPAAFPGFVFKNSLLLNLEGDLETINQLNRNKPNLSLRKVHERLYKTILSQVTRVVRKQLHHMFYICIYFTYYLECVGVLCCYHMPV